MRRAHVMPVWRYAVLLLAVGLTALALHLREGDQRGWVYVDADTWQSYEQGQHYPDAR